MRTLAAAAVLSAALAAGVSASHAGTRSEWDFLVRLDGQAIGTHRFSLAPSPAGGLSLTSEAQFAVKLLGWTAYRYRHVARERWQGNCLAALDASTDDDGRVTQVQGRRTASGFSVDVGNVSATAVEGCLMSFAYWNPGLAAQRRLLDPGSGRIEAVRIQPLPPTQLETGDGRGPVRGWRIEGLPAPIDVWYEGDEWIGLDTTVRGGRRLTYRLR